MLQIGDTKRHMGGREVCGDIIFCQYYKVAYFCYGQAIFRIEHLKTSFFGVKR